MKPGLYCIATPIGNLEDITIRALKTLFDVDILLCEDTRTTQKLLTHYQESASQGLFPKFSNHHPKLIAYHEHNEQITTPSILKALKEGRAIGLVSDAGTPLISDPGYLLVKTCHHHQIPVFSIPGPSSITTALSIAGLPTDKVIYLGFLPRKAAKQRKIWEDICLSNFNQTIIFFESPLRFYNTLQILGTTIGDVEITVVRELTKIHEEVETQTISQWLSQKEQLTRGEIVVLFTLPKPA